MTITLANLDAAVETREERDVEQRQRTVRVTLSKQAKHRVDLSWNPGGRFGRKQPLFLQPGHTVVLPIDRAGHFFGPFAQMLELETVTEEDRREQLVQTIRNETKRVLNQYDYERPLSKGKDGYEPIGPHRFPDVSVVIVNADDTEEKPMRLHELYQIGDWDPLRDQLVKRESIDDMEKRHKQELETVEKKAAEDVRELRLETAKALGMVKGLSEAVKAKH
jgi:hypothetical protein